LPAEDSIGPNTESTSQDNINIISVLIGDNATSTATTSSQSDVSVSSTDLIKTEPNNTTPPVLSPPQPAIVDFVQVYSPLFDSASTTTP
jgi:hypothetical protein